MSTALLTQPTDSSKSLDLGFSNDVLEEMRSIHDQIAREAFGLFQQRDGDQGSALGDWLQAESKLLDPVPITISDEKNELKVTAAIPGFKASDLKVHVDREGLQICGKSETKSGNGETTSANQEHVSSIRKVCCSVGLPAPVKPEASKATLDDKGVLTLLLRKAEPAKEIAVKSA